MNILKCRALLALLATTLIWGFFPLYLSLLGDMALDTVMIQRVIWSVILGWLLVAIRRDWQTVTLRQFILLAVTATLLGIFWFAFVWAVPNHHVLDLSLGNFLAPLLMTTCGVIFFKERLQPLEQLAIGFAVIGLLILIFGSNHFPWIAGVVATSLGLYSVLRKHMGLSPSIGFAMEVSFLLLAALTYSLQHPGTATNFGGGYYLALLIGTAVLTVAPMTLYGMALRNLKMATVSMVGYIAPTIAFLTGIFYFHEPVSPLRLAAFTCVWIGLGIYSYNAWRRDKRVNVVLTE